MADGRTDAELYAGLLAVVEGTGEHADHERRQVGRCVHCSCGERVQGRMDPGARQGARPRRWRVVLGDGFEAWTGDSRARADDVAARHEGAKVEDGRG